MVGLKSGVKRLAARFGLDVRRKEATAHWRLAEMSESDVSLFEKVRPYTMTSRQRLWATIIAARHVARNGIAGAFVECGVWRGGQAMAAAATFRSEKSDRHIHLFDTFAGMTEPTTFDEHDGISARDKFISSQAGEHNEWCYASIDEVRDNLRKIDYDPALLHFVKGPVETTLSGPGNLPDRIAVLRLDTDWYESTKAELEYLYPKLAIGGVLLIDDYGHWAGARKAVDEYFEAIGVYPLLQPVDYTARMLVKL